MNRTTRYLVALGYGLLGLLLYLMPAKTDIIKDDIGKNENVIIEEKVPLKPCTYDVANYIFEKAQAQIEYDEPNPVQDHEPIKEETEVPIEEYTDGDEITIPYDNLEMLAILVMAESENQPELGKRLVIDAVLNRVDDPRFPNTVYEVIMSPGQFEPMVNGRFERCHLREDDLRLVLEECLYRTNSEVIWFRAGSFFDWATPIMQVGGHFFSK